MVNDMKATTPERERITYGALTLLDHYSKSMDEIAEAAERVAAKLIADVAEKS